MSPRKNKTEPKERGNYVSEWFGHRVYPIVADTPASLDDQRARRCPFLSQATGQNRECIKPASAKGICTINSPSNGVRQDWLICPYRALDPTLINSVARRLFDVPDDQQIVAVPAPTLALASTRAMFIESVNGGAVGVVYFESKLGGEISIKPTTRSPELSFDFTMVRVIVSEGAMGLGQYGILELQTMDFHGSYKRVVNNLSDALRLYEERFHGEIRSNTRWLGEKIEGPNIANVFKRTFYQLMLKFQIGADESCAGCVLALPVSVWDSWQRHLGRPDFRANEDGTYSFDWGTPREGRPPAWIYLFDLDVSEETSPNRLVIRRVIATDAEAMGHFALEVAPEAAVAGEGSADRVLATIRRRVGAWWPELARGPVKIGTDAAPMDS